MHELAIVIDLIDQVTREVHASGETGEVVRVGLVIGRLSGVHADAVRFAFDAIKPGTIVEHADLEIDEPQARRRCSDCGAETPVEEIVGCCPRCSSHRTAIVGGRDLTLQTIDLQTDPPGAPP